jgi:hypothetical protein
MLAWYDPLLVHLNIGENLLWGIGAALKVSLCALVFYRRLYRRFPFFTLYASLLVAEVAFVWFAYRTWGYTSRAGWYAYWLALGIVLTARGLVIAELCSACLKNYAGLWSLARRLLLLAALALLASASFAAVLNGYRIDTFVLAAERGLELAAAVILILLFAISVRYKVWLEPMERSILLGLALYSIFQMLNRTFMSPWMTPYFSWWESVRIGCFDIAMLIWLYPLRQPLPSASEAPALISEQVVLDLLRQLLQGMRELTNELKRMVKTIWK